MIQRSAENWNVQENPPLPPPSQDDLPLDLTAMVPISELMWDSGLPRMVVRPQTEGEPPPVAGGTLESLVNRSATIQHFPPLAMGKRSNRTGCSVGVAGGGNEVVVVPWNGSRSQGARTSSDTLMQAVAVDGLVPCNKKAKADEGPKGSHVPSYGTCSAKHAGSCSVVAGAWKTRVSVSDTGSLISQGLTFTTSSLGNTSSAANQITKGGEEHDSASHSINEMYAEEEKKKAKGKAPQVSTKKNRAADVHNQSERKRRDKINEKMRTLQKMVPNASKTDKASMLDEVIDYLKQMKAQISLMTKMPALVMQQQLQLMSLMGMGMGPGSPVPYPNFFIPNALEAFVAGGEPPQPQAADPCAMFVARQQNEVRDGNGIEAAVIDIFSSTFIPLNSMQTIGLSAWNSRNKNETETDVTTDARARVAELYHQQYQQGHGA